MDVIYRKSMVEEVVGAVARAKREGKVIKEIILSGDEWRIFEKELCRCETYSTMKSILEGKEVIMCGVSVRKGIVH